MFDQMYHFLSGCLGEVGTTLENDSRHNNIRTDSYIEMSFILYEKFDNDNL